MTDAEMNPIGFLQEMCQKYFLKLPEYKEINSVGPDHCRQFTFKCSFEGYETSGLSRQKKQAKSESAKAMVCLLKERDYFNKKNVQNSLKDDNVDQLTDAKLVPVEHFTDVTKNAISVLLEYCQKNKLAPPHFMETSVHGTFVFECKLGNNKVYGNGINKKAAKNEAAVKLCVKLGLKCNGIENLSPEAEEELHSRKNPISALQELCQRKSINNVEYTIMPSFMNLFVVKCTADSISCEGRGQTKKIAKSQAASKVLLQLGAQNLYENGQVNTEDNRSKIPTLSSVLNSEGAGAVRPNHYLEDFKIDSSEEEDNTNDKEKASEDNDVNLNDKVAALSLEQTDNNFKLEPDSQIKGAQEGPVESG